MRTQCNRAKNVLCMRVRFWSEFRVISPATRRSGYKVRSNFLPKPLPSRLKLIFICQRMRDKTLYSTISRTVLEDGWGMLYEVRGVTMRHACTAHFIHVTQPIIYIGTGHLLLCYNLWTSAVDTTKNYKGFVKNIFQNGIIVCRKKILIKIPISPWTTHKVVPRTFKQQ